MKTKLYFDSLSIEVTRKCNMNCAHCLRGESEKTDLDLSNVRKLLEHTEHINMLTLTGGEPSLAIDKIEQVLDICNEMTIPIDSFYVVTNGKEVTDRFLCALIKWYAYCIQYSSEPELSGIALSKDQFHEPIPEINERLLRSLAFFTEDKMINTKKPQYVIPMGRAQNIDRHEYNIEYTYWRNDEEEDPTVEFRDEMLYIESTVALTCDGEILKSCDYPYDNTKPYRIGDVDHMDDLEQYLTQLAIANGDDVPEELVS